MLHLQSYDVVLDASSDECPIPTIRSKEVLDKMPAGGILKLIASASGTVRNIRMLTCNQAYELIGESREDGKFVLLIRKINVAEI